MYDPADISAMSEFHPNENKEEIEQKFHESHLLAIHIKNPLCIMLRIATYLAEGPLLVND